MAAQAWSESGKAYLIGAGPGDPRLLTLRAVEALGESEIVFTDELVDPAALVHARHARIVHVGKRCGRRSLPQEATTRLLVDTVARGAVAARLKGGDPFVFGRGGEEALALAGAGLRFEIVPGVSAALGAAAHAGIPLTHRGIASSVAFVSGHAGGRVAGVSADTIVVFMCQRTIGAIARELVESGRAPSTPIAIVRGATCEGQEVYLGTLDEAAALPEPCWAGLDPALPTLAIVGDVARLATSLAWNTRPMSLWPAPAAAAGGAR